MYGCDLSQEEHAMNTLLSMLMTLQLLQKILKHSAMSSRKGTISSSKVLDPLSTILAAHTRKTLMEP